MDKIIKKIVAETEKIKGNINKILPVIDDEIDEIITNGNKDIRRIEHILDTLMDYSYLGLGEPLFKKLNDYYASFNMKNAKEYEEYYKDLTYWSK